jgi:DNA-binding GntR family transcriptional regulator
MTAQRALRELQQRGLTYAVVGKGTSVADNASRRGGAAMDACAPTRY